jgi:hypothetical protein
MPAATSLWESPIPSSVAAPPGRAVEAMRAALLDLLWLALYVTVMRMLGYRIRREATRTAPAPRQPAQTNAAQPSAPAKPRRKHRYIDRQMCLDLLASIDRQVAAVAPQQSPAPQIIIRRPAAHHPHAGAYTVTLGNTATRVLPLGKPPDPSKRAQHPNAFARPFRYDVRTKGIL